MKTQLYLSGNGGAAINVNFCPATKRNRTICQNKMTTTIGSENKSEHISNMYMCVETSAGLPAYNCA